MENLLAFLSVAQVPVFFVGLYHLVVALGLFLIFVSDDGKVNAVEFFRSFLIFITCVAYINFL